MASLYETLSDAQQGEAIADTRPRVRAHAGANPSCSGIAPACHIPGSQAIDGDTRRSG